MRILIYEHITGGGLSGEALPHSLAQEGDLMLQALLRDLALVPETELWVCRDARLPLPSYGINIRELQVREGDDADALLDNWIPRCDAVWPIAPETGALLENLCARVQAAGKLLLTSPADAVRVCGDKLHTFERLRQYAIPAVETHPLLEQLPGEPRRWVVKARDGVGCADTAIIETVVEFMTFRKTIAHPEHFILQAFTPGRPASLSCLFKHGKACLLSYNQQQIVIAGRRFELHGCFVNAPCADWELYQQLSERVAQAFPELWGYAGVDFIATAQGPVILEVNPRLTTSYAGLRQALQRNVAQQVVALLHAGLPRATQTGQAVTVTIPREGANE